MGCHRLPRDEGSWARPEVPRLDRVCQLCGAGTLGDERHLVFDRPGLLCFREQWSHLFEGPQTMQAFMWQEDLIGIVRFINACLHKMNPICQTSDQPGVAGRDVICSDLNAHTWESDSLNHGAQHNRGRVAILLTLVVDSVMCTCSSMSKCVP